MTCCARRCWARERDYPRIASATSCEPVPDHRHCHVEDDQQPDPGDPAVALEQPRDQVGRDPHQHHRKHQPDDQVRDFLRRPGHRQHVVQAHRHVRQDDLHHRLAQRLRLASPAALSTCGRRSSRNISSTPTAAAARRQAAARDRQQLQRDRPEGDADHRRAGDAEQDGAGRVCRSRQSGHRHPDDDGIVAGQREIDQHDLSERDQVLRPVPIQVKAFPALCPGGRAGLAAWRTQSDKSTQKGRPAMVPRYSSTADGRHLGAR